MTELDKRTWPEAAEIFTEDTIAILPIGSTEPHGPHLPLDTDVTIALAQSRSAAEQLQARGVRSIVLPALPYGLTNFTAGFAGGITLRPGTLWAILEDIVRSLEDQGIQRIVFSNGHLEPAHVQILRGVLLDHSKRSKGRAHVIFPDNTRRRFAATLGDEFASGECHAGRYETSIVLAADESAVRMHEAEKLPAHEIHLIEKMKSGVISFKDAGADQAYCGDPASASAAEGSELIERLAEMIVTSVEETWPELFA